MKYYVTDNMDTESSLKVLKIALKHRNYKSLQLIHPSDNGLQYCADYYQKELHKSEILSSMTQNSDRYKNAIAESINGFIKKEFMVDK